MSYQPETLVERDVNNVAHVVSGDDWLCGPRKQWPGIPEDIRKLLLHTWELNQDSRFQAFPSPPCSRCIARGELKENR